MVNLAQALAGLIRSNPQLAADVQRELLRVSDVSGDQQISDQMTGDDLQEGQFDPPDDIIRNILPQLDAEHLGAGSRGGSSMPLPPPPPSIAPLPGPGPLTVDYSRRATVPQQGPPRDPQDVNRTPPDWAKPDTWVGNRPSTVPLPSRTPAEEPFKPFYESTWTGDIGASRSRHSDPYTATPEEVEEIRRRVMRQR